MKKLLVALGFILSLLSLNVAANPNPGSLSFAYLYFSPSPCLGVSANFNIIVAGNGSNFQYHYDFGDLNSVTNNTTELIDSAFHTYQAIGTYQVAIQITNELNDTLDTLIAVSILPSPQITIVSQTQDSVICDGEAIVFEPGGDPVPNYYWNSPYATSYTYSVYYPGTYYLTGVASNGCSGWDSIVVTAGPTPAPLNYQTIYNYCVGDQVQITPSGFDNTLTYAWFPSADISDIGIYNPVITPSGGNQSYIVSANNGGCSVYDTIYFQTTNFANIIAQGSQAYLCGNTSINLYTNSPFSTYLWSTNASISNIQINTSGSYSLIVTDSYGCLGYDTILILDGVVPPALDYPDSIAYCPFSFYQISPLTPYPNLTYAWNPPIGLDNPTLMDPTISGMYSQVYVVVGSNGECAVTDTVVLYPTDFSDAIPGGTTGSFCVGNLYSLTGSGNYQTYSWSTGETTQSINVSQPGIYYLFVTDQNGCQGADSVFVTQFPVPHIDTVLQSSTCPGSSASLYAGVSSGTGPMVYSWSNGFFMDTISVVVSSVVPSYTVQVYDANGCVSNNYQHNLIIDANSCDSVWPGENNGDFVVNNMDLFNIGSFYGQSISSRPTQSIDWSAQFAGFSAPAANFPWVDMKHSDSNGDGTIDSQDTLAIIQNYGLVEGKTEWENNLNADLLMRVVNPYTSIIQGGQALSLPVRLGDAANLAQNLYSIGFTINYHPEQIVPSSLGFRFNSTFMGANQSEQISIRKVDYNNGKIYVACTRINQQPVSNFGDIGEVYCITVENLSGKTEETVSQFVPFTLSDVVLVDHQRLPISVQTQSDSVLVDFQTSIKDQNLQIANVYPNPFEDQIRIQMSGTVSEASVRIYSLEGRLVKQFHSIRPGADGCIYLAKIGDLEKGTYVVQVKDQNAVSQIKRIVRK